MKQNITVFKGFSPKLLEFLKNLKQNNNKVWFDAHKEDYENYMKKPSIALIQDMGNLFLDRNLPLVAEPKKSMFRIYRDIRFSSNKEPYKTNLGIYFPFGRAGIKPVFTCGFYFHFDTDESFVGGGIHLPETNILKSIRKKIADDFEIFTKIITDKKLTKAYDNMFMGDSLKKVPQGYPTDHPAAEYLKMKEYTVGQAIKFEETYSAGLIDLLFDKAAVLLPFLEFLDDAIKMA